MYLRVLSLELRCSSAEALTQEHRAKGKTRSYPPKPSVLLQTAIKPKYVELPWPYGRTLLHLSIVRKNVRDKLFILCDCLSVINVVLHHDEIDSHINVSERVRSLLHTLNDLDIDVTLGLIPGHSHIYYNDLVESKVKLKTVAKDAYNIPTSAEFTTQI